MALYHMLIGPKDANRNIRAAFVSWAFFSVGFGMLWSGLLSIFILFLADDSKALLGIAAMIAGIVSTMFVFPSGYIADRWRRDVLIWIGSIVRIFAVFVIAFSSNIEMVFIGEGLLGAGMGISQSAREALIADSIPSGQRSQIYAGLFFLQMGFAAVGPGISIIIFLILGDTWKLETLRIVIFLAAILVTLSSITNLFMSDKNALGEESESITSRKNNLQNNQKESSFGIPIVLIFSGLIVGFGAGMTVAFFGPFFKEEYAVRPILVSIIFFFTQLTTGFSGIIGQKISKRLGLIETMFFLQMSAIYALAFITKYPPLLILIPLFIARSALMNSSAPLSRTIIMDRIAKRHRGKWNALEFVAFGFFWNVSAAVGGWIIENYSYVVCFTITATLYTLATLPLLALFGKVGKEGVLQDATTS